jgi:hypothetical protein
MLFELRDKVKSLRFEEGIVTKIYDDGEVAVRALDGDYVVPTSSLELIERAPKKETPKASKEIYKNSYLLLSHTPKSHTKNGDSYDVVIDENTTQGLALLERLSAEGYNIKPLYETENKKLISSRKLWLELREDKTLEPVVHEN